MGGRRRAGCTQRWPPLTASARNRTPTSPRAPFPKILKTTQQARPHHPHRTVKETKVGAGQAHCPRTLTDTSPQLLGLLRTPEASHGSGCLGGGQGSVSVRKAMVLRRLGWPALVFQVSARLAEMHCPTDTLAARSGQLSPPLAKYNHFYS